MYVTYFDSLGLAKGVFRVTVSTTLLTLSIVRSAGYFATGVFRAEDLMLVAAALVPAADRHADGRMGARSHRAGGVSPVRRRAAA